MTYGTGFEEDIIRGIHPRDDVLLAALDSGQGCDSLLEDADGWKIA